MIPASRVRTVPKTKGKKKKKRKRIIESDNQSENDEEYELKMDGHQLQDVNTDTHNQLTEMLSVNKQENLENSTGENNIEMKDEGRLQEAASTGIEQVTLPQEEVVSMQKIKKVSTISNTTVLQLAISTYCNLPINID